jgi:hypothetical protein
LKRNTQKWKTSLKNTSKEKLMEFASSKRVLLIQGDSNMTGTDLCVNKPQSVPVIFEPPCTYYYCFIQSLVIILASVIQKSTEEPAHHR